jgi:putative ABC transport system permease protein
MHRGNSGKIRACRSGCDHLWLRDAATLLAAGIAIGVVAAIASAATLQSMLYGTGPRNPAVLAMVCMAVALAGLIAAYIPAGRAAKVDPMVALRYE